MSLTEPSEFRVEKSRVDAVVNLTNGASVAGNFFVAQSGATFAGQERVAELLNSEAGFFPFEVREAEHAHTVLMNRDHVVTVTIRDREALLDPGYEVATARTVSVLMSDGRHVQGSVRVYQPEGHDRLSDWARHSERFRYIETADVTFIVNADHIVEAHEVIGG